MKTIKQIFFFEKRKQLTVKQRENVNPNAIK